MIGLMADLFSEGYGGEMHVDRERVGITWATFPHLYANFYVFQYATSFTASSALAEKVLSGDPGATTRYLTFLGSGGSDYPIALLKEAGVDMTTDEPLELTIRRMNEVMDEMEKLLASTPAAGR